jgi:hypothetical protein
MFEALRAFLRRGKDTANFVVPAALLLPMYTQNWLAKSEGSNLNPILYNVAMS